MTNHGFWKTCLKFFVLCMDADSKNQQNGVRPFDPQDEKWWPRDPARNGLNDELIHAAKVNADPNRGA